MQRPWETVPITSPLVPPLIHIRWLARLPSSPSTFLIPLNPQVLASHCAVLLSTAPPPSGVLHPWELSLKRIKPDAPLDPARSLNSTAHALLTFHPPPAILPASHPAVAPAALLNLLGMQRPWETAPSFPLVLSPIGIRWLAHLPSSPSLFLIPFDPQVLAIHCEHWCATEPNFNPPDGLDCPRYRSRARLLSTSLLVSFYLPLLPNFLCLLSAFLWLYHTVQVPQGLRIPKNYSNQRATWRNTSTRLQFPICHSPLPSTLTPFENPSSCQTPALPHSRKRRP